MNVEKEIEVAEEIMGQLQDEGAHDQVISDAKALTHGQFRDAEVDLLAAAVLLLEAFALMMVRHGSRPTCCAIHEAQWIAQQMGALNSSLMTMAEREAKGKPDAV